MAGEADANAYMDRREYDATRPAITTHVRCVASFWSSRLALEDNETIQRDMNKFGEWLLKQPDNEAAMRHFKEAVNTDINTVGFWWCVRSLDAWLWEWNHYITSIQEWK